MLADAIPDILHIADDDDPIQFRRVLAAMRARDYTVHSARDFQMNVVGVRRMAFKVNQFNDVLFAFYPLNGQWQYLKFQITTLPGLFYLNDALGDPRGTAILVPGQYTEKYVIRQHDDLYDALCQKQDEGVFVQVYRDSLLDGLPQLDPATITDATGINLHHADPEGCTISVDKYSSGCQVFRCVAQFNAFMALVKHAGDLHGNSFTYTLLHDDDL